MRKTIYILRNNSKSTGTYYVNGEYQYLYPNEVVELNKTPTSVTKNISISYYRKELGETILQLKKKKITTQK